jgi:hypothetical protein
LEVVVRAARAETGENSKMRRTISGGKTASGYVVNEAPAVIFWEGVGGGEVKRGKLQGEVKS